MAPQRIWLFMAAMIMMVPAAIFYLAWRSANDRGKPALPDSRDNADKEVVLDQEKQKQIWDNEHITFEIEKRFGTALLQALLKRDKTRVRSFLRNPFRGEILANAANCIRQKDFLKETIRDRNTSARITVDAEGLAGALLSPLDRFKKVERKRLRVLQIEQLSKTPGRWRAKLLLDLTGVDRKDRPLYFLAYHWIECTIEDELKLGEVASIDIWHVHSETWRSSERYLLEEATQAARLDNLPIRDNWKLPPRDTLQASFQIAVADYNRDGWLDIAVSSRFQQPLLLKSVRGKYFQNVADTMNLKDPRDPPARDCFVAAWIDYDNDGWPDLLLGDRLYRNDKGGRFIDVTERSGLRFWAECMGAVPADYDGDGLLDLYLLYQQDHEVSAPFKTQKWVDDDETGKQNQLWRNEGGGRFRDATLASNAGGGNHHTFAASWFFYDDDHWPDLYLANDFGKNVILRNCGDGTFKDVSDQSGAEDFATSMGVATGDINNDGHTDIYVANMFSKMGRRIIGQVCDADYPKGVFQQIKGSCAGNRLYLKQKSGRYRDFGEELGVHAVGWAYAPAIFDLDGDGWLDLYGATGFMSFQRNKPDG